MHVLITGCTSQQCNPAANKNITNYVGLFRRALQLNGHDVTWGEPSVTWSARDALKRFDHVVLGIAPVTSLSANRAYGALSLYSELMDADRSRLTLMVDAPQPERIAAGNRAIMAHPENLVKPFYSYRREYSIAQENERKLLEAVRRLHEETWPSTIVPTLPWHDERQAANWLPYPVERVIPLNLDALLFQGITWEEIHNRSEVWVTEGKINAPVSWPQRPIKHKGAVAWDTSVMRQMSASSGVLLESPKEGTWWNSRYAQALATGTPVFSNWIETREIGNEWSVLPARIETVAPWQRSNLAVAQLRSYSEAMSNFSVIKDKIHSILTAKRPVTV